MARVVLKHLAKIFPNGFHAVWDLNLEIADGELVVLAGPSGCGKTTTLRMIAGLEQPSRGLVYIGDRLVNDVAPSNRDVAMVFQGYALYPHMSVRENMAFGLKMRRTPRAEIEKRVRECAEILSIEPLLDRRPDELSGGERQRVALGRAIVREPKVFLFDEPLSNLDAKLRAEMRTEIAQLHQRLKTTIIYVTHDQVEAMTLGERIVLINHGSIQQTGPPLDIYRRPANEFVASFIGSPEMNFFGGQVRDGVFTLDTRPILHAFGAGQYFVGGHVLTQEEYEARISQPAEKNLESREIPVGKAIEDGPATLGIRPQDFLTGANGHPFATVTVDVVEHLGHESFAHFTLTGFKHIARLPADTQVQGGDRLALSIQSAAIHLFSASGRRMN